MRKQIIKLYTIQILLVLLVATAISPGCSLNSHPSTVSVTVSTSEAEAPGEIERHEIYSLLAFAVVLKDWQNNDMQYNTGYNIGSVLVDNQKHKVVYWARNSVNKTHNVSQHGEVRLMTCYLASLGDSGHKDLKYFTVYTTLEPCAMCSGMMMLTNVFSTVYGQSDPSYGKALERLELDSRNQDGSGYPPYPRFVKSIPSTLKQREKLEALYQQYSSVHSSPHITQFLTTDEAKQVFTDALIDLQKFVVKYPENQAVLDQALDFYRSVPDHYVEQCPQQ